MFGDVIHDTGVRLLRDKESGVFEVRNINIVQKQLIIWDIVEFTIRNVPL